MSNFTPAQKAAFVELLKDAKTRLWDGADGPRPDGAMAYICYAIGDDADDHDDELRREIMRRLDGYLGISGWLLSQSGVRPSDVTNKNLQAHRLAWVDKLIEEFSQ